MRHCVGILRRGFTIVELLMVIVIIGVVSAIIAPRIGAAMSGGKLRVGARGVMQAARYAHTMALLHQIDVDLVFVQTPEQAKVRVEAAPVSGERADGGTAGRIELAADEEGANGKGAGDSATKSPLALSPGFYADDGQYGSAVSSGAQLSAAELAEEIKTEIESLGCTYSFGGYTDHGREIAAKSPGDEGEVRVRFRSNGTCRPFYVRVSVTDDDALYVAFDLLGTSTVTEEVPR